VDALVAVACEARRFVEALGSPVPPLIAQREAYAERIADRNAQDTFRLWWDVLTYHLRPARVTPAVQPPAPTRNLASLYDEVRAAPACKSVQQLLCHVNISSGGLYARMRADAELETLVRSKLDPSCST
jgi:hypothetical protein